MTLPSDAHIVVIGGGIVGCSVAYHLGHLGIPNVVLLEQNELAGGTTWHAAGLVGRLRASNSMTWVNQYSADLYSKLETETGIATGWRSCGSLMLATCKERMTQIARTAAMAQVFGVEAHLLEPRELGDLFPHMRTDDLLGGAFLPGDGRVHPEQTTKALAIGAEMQGVQIITQCEVLNIDVRAHQVRTVRTSQGNIDTNIIVLCGGMWTRQLAQKFEVHIPLHPVEHHYIQTEPIEGIHEDLPICRDPDAAIYFRPEQGAILLGAFQKHSKPWLQDPVPSDFSFGLLEDDWDHFSKPLAAGRRRLPALETTGIAKFVNGPESFTPDNNFLLGEVPNLKGCFVAAGFNSAGIACAGGAGKALASWIVDGAPPMDLWAVDIRRFSSFHNQSTFLQDRVSEVLGLHYRMAWPNREAQTGRNVLRSPLHHRLASLGACFGQKMGWERPNWFSSNSPSPDMDYTFERPAWLAYSAKEHLGCRERVALFDQSSFSKFELHGQDALRILQRLCAANLNVPIGKTVYTSMLNERGTFESDLTVIRAAVDSYYLVSGTAQRVRDFDWISRHIPRNASVRLRDVTEDSAVIGVMGPQSRALLQSLTSSPLDHERFPFATSRLMRIGDHELRAVRITYVGELGWELHMNTSEASDVYDFLWQAGQELGVTNAGHYAINSLRLEKGYLAWGTDISTDESPLQAGLGFVIDWNKSCDFLGKDALRRQKQQPLQKRMFLFVAEDSSIMLWGNEPIFADDELVGYTTSAAYAHTLGSAIAAGYVRLRNGQQPSDVLQIPFAIQVGERMARVRPYLRSPYDPQRQRILM